MSVYLVGLLWVLGVAVLAGVAAFLKRRRFGSEEETDNEPLCTVFTLVGGLNAVLVAFVLIGLFDSAGTARADTFREADGLVAISWSANSLPETNRTRVHELARSYASTVIEHEWPRMRDGQRIDDTGWTQLNEMRRTVEQISPTDDWQQNRKDEMADRLWEVYQARQERVNASSGEIDVVIWFALAIGGIASVALTYLFDGVRLPTYLLMASTTAAAITLLLFAIYQMQNPFGGGASIDPDAFRSALGRIG